MFFFAKKSKDFFAYGYMARMLQNKSKLDWDKLKGVGYESINT